MIRKWGPWLVMAAVMVAALSVANFGGRSPKNETDRIDAISGSVRCPTCRGQSVRESNAPAAQAIRGEIARQVRSGEDDDEIYAYLVSRYGQRILLNPPQSGVGALVWVFPACGVVIAVAALGGAMWRWKATSKNHDDAVDVTHSVTTKTKRVAPVAVAAAVGLLAIGAGVGVAASSGTRRPGDVATGVAEDAQLQRMEQAAALAKDDKQIEALKVYDKILSEDPEHVGALLERGLLLGVVGRSAQREALMQEGSASIDRALALRPRDPRALFYRGLVLRLMGDDASALASFAAAREADPPPELRSSIEGFLKTAGVGDPAADASTQN